MKPSILLSAAILLAPSVYAADLNNIHASEIRALEISVPAPVPAVESEKVLDGQYLCYGDSCSITTSATNVCSDGMKIVTEFKSSEYIDENLKKWAEYQRNIGKSAKWRDPSHQNTTATGKVNPFQIAYVVVPGSQRKLLNKVAKVCVLATGKCITAEVREVGPAFGEISVGAMMQLGLDAHPWEGRYTGRISYTFSN
ncbi:MAG: hypothetical protein NTX59_11010 [Elusimicrobia bacterium]|nr:hypothetical protein [Elusimicrobiota bacterium]